MSYPPRPPMGMPPMPPGMMPQGYGFPPMGMMPMGMGMMPMMSPQVNSNTPPPNKPKKLIPQEIPSNDKKDEKPPVTTVFVGNISDRAPDAMIRQMLQRCGNVLSWKRVQGASGKLQAFGFCEYEDPEATLRCIRLLNEWQIIDKKLVVKVDAKTRTLLDDYKRKKKEKEKGPGQVIKDKKEEDGDKEEGEADDETSTLDDPLDEFTMREDRVAKAGLDAIMREYAEDLNKEPPAGRDGADREKKERKKAKEKETVRDGGIDDMNIEDEKKDLISREIRSFRDAHKGEDDREREREKEREVRRRRDEDRDRERRERERRERDRERERERKAKERQLKERPARSRSRERTPSRERERERERDREREMREIEDEEEMYERRKLERKMREKEAAYQEMLKKWEARERKKAREYEKEKEREEDRKIEESREGRRLKEFLEDYNDDRDDPKYYKGSGLQRRLKEREKEMEIDERDRQREKEELENIRRQLIEEGHPDPEAEMARIERERDEHLMPRLHEQPEEEEEEEIIEEEPVQQQSMSQDEDDQMQPQQAEMSQMYHQQNGVRGPQGAGPTQQAVVAQYASSQGSLSDDDDAGTPGMAVMASEDSQSQSQSYISSRPSQEDLSGARLGFSDLKLGAAESPQEQPSGKRKKLTVGEVFNQDEETAQGPRKRKLIPLDYSDEERAAVGVSKPTTAEEKRKCIKNLIERIPTAKEELFDYRLDWTMVDKNLMERRIKPWINKKIVEYIGEEEPTLTDFICQKVMGNSMPQNILDDVAMVLDEEAEVFVVKMWRLLIYETEAKKLGLVK